MKIIADYKATKGGQVIYAGTLSVECENSNEAIKAAVVAELSGINDQYGGGIADSVVINSWSES
ncbi:MULTISPECIES: hypothetical protein [Klebsiella]|uniref:hypothetical protein n=1 Tax=Klebsiella TaxID=570 RepID=UPI0011EF4ED6|nr:MULTISPECIES: hypothetical protein [Klebsiella]KAA0472853.1 hypothetical protein F0333_03085 [Klebsiella aerogenes]MDF9964945.1 hypothetical protein [Klebsiella pneumoniae]HEN5160724.1 hypothetical protein [Klebsiella pneumoniae]